MDDVDDDGLEDLEFEVVGVVVGRIEEREVEHNSIANCLEEREEKEVAVQFHLFDKFSARTEKRLPQNQKVRCLVKRNNSPFQRIDEQSNPKKWEALQI